jgi:phage baseplate assembly protein W
MTQKGIAGTTWPWNRGVPDFVYDEDVVDIAIRDILLTSVGERKMNTSYGSELVRILFENQGDLMHAMAIREITTALHFHLPSIKVVNVDVQDATSDNDPVDILITYDYQGVRQQASLSAGDGS